MLRAVPPTWSRLGGVVAALLPLLLVLSACQARADVEVLVADDGSGEVVATVALDPEAAGGLLDLETGLPLEDLAQAGWRIEPPTVGDDGWTRIEAAKDFGTPEQLATVLDELDGPEGVLRQFELERAKSFARVDYRLTGVLDPTGGLDLFADPELQAQLGTSLGELAAREGADPSQVVLRLRAELPGQLREADLTGTSIPGERAVTWSVTLADPEPVVVQTAATSRLVAPLVLRGVAVVAAVLTGLVLLGHALRLVRPEARRPPATAVRPKVVARPPAGKGPPRAPVATEPAAGQGALPPPKVVALDAMGVLYREGDDVHRLLIPFARERGSLLSEAKLVELSRSLSLGRILPAEFWAQIGAIGEPAKLDRDYLALHQLNPGVVKFLRTLRERGIRAACITNDAAAWASALRRRHSLEGLIDLWIISGAVGVRKPDQPIFEALRRVAQVPTSEILVIDDDRDNLDSARDMGFRTAWFTPDGDEAEANGHAVLRSLDVPAAPGPRPERSVQA